VSAVDPVPGLLERARERARAERLPARFQLGDARAIPFGDASFDVVLSVFGVTFAPDARQAAAELVRVCRPGGTLALTTWTPESFIGTMLRRIGRQTCPTRRSSDPTTWSSEQGIRSLFGAHVHALEMSPRKFVFRCRSPEHFQELVQINCSVALSSLGPSDHLEEDAAVPRVAPIIRRFNQAEDGSMIVPSDYVEIVAIKRSFPTL
jgi:SAM-dependent methyltransferase